MSKSVVFALVLASLPVFGQAPSQASAQAYPAEMALPFGTANGKIVVSGDYLIFVSDPNVEKSFVIPRDNVQSVSSDGGMTTIAFKQSMRDQAGERNRVIVRFTDQAAADAVMQWSKAAPGTQSGAAPSSGSVGQGEQLFNYSVKHDHKLGSCTGRLMATPDKLIFESLTDVNDSRQWGWRDIKEVGHKNPYKLEVKPFTGNDYSFDFLGKGMDNADFAALTKRIADARANR